MSANKPNFKPMADFVLVELLPRGQTPGGLALPEQADSDEPAKGRVARVGGGRMTEYGVLLDPEVREGDLVYMFFAYEPPEISLEGKRYKVVRDRDIIGVVET